MALKVKEARLIGRLKSLELVAGEKGLDKDIDKIGVLDHEVVTGIIGEFRKGDFVLSSFVAARNNEAYLEKCIRDLIACNVSALVIKKVFYHKLPESLLALANAHALPIFMAEPEIYFDDIIEDLLEGMHTRSHMALIESKIELLFKNSLKPLVVKALAKELNHAFKDHLIVVYLKEKQFTSDEKLIKIAERYHRSRAHLEHHSLFKYDEGFLLIMSYDELSNHQIDMDFIFNQMQMEKEDYYIGESRQKSLTTLDEGVKEAVYASQVGEAYQKYEDLGIYKLILPYKEDIWMKSFVEEMLRPLTDPKLVETAQVYVYNKGDIKKTSQMLFQHINSTRYRLNRIKALMHLETDYELYESLSLALKCQKVMED